MQSISLRIRGVQAAFSGQIAGQRIQSALAFAFSRPCQFTEVSLPSTERELAWQNAQAELEGRRIVFAFAHSPHASYFRSEEADFWIDAQGNNAELTRCKGDPHVWLFGPLLILALARRGIFCLHASAVQLPIGAIVLLGASGAGKSTFARAMASARLCDDISPLSFVDHQLLLLPQFPQLKLERPDTVPESAKLVALLYLQAAIAMQPECISAMTAGELHHQLLAHTVASRLFTANDCQRWWHAIARWCTSLETQSYRLRPAYDASAPDRAMLAALALFSAQR